MKYLDTELSSLSSLADLLVLPIFNGCFNSIFRQHRAMELDRWQFQVRGNVPILDGQNFLYTLSLNPFSSNRTRGNSRTTPKRLELGFCDITIGVDFDLHFHDITTCWCTNKTLSKNKDMESDKCEIRMVLTSAYGTTKTRPVLSPTGM
jgi:hypothetical protein